MAPLNRQTPNPLAALAVEELADYVVVLKNTERDVVGTASRLTSARGGRVTVTWQHVLKGFAAQLTPAAAVPGDRRRAPVQFARRSGAE